MWYRNAAIINREKYDMTERVKGDLYDFPVYYDLIFGSDWKAEFDFLIGCFEKFAKKKVKRIFEPACGTGRLLIKLAQAGFEVSGNDLNERAVKFCNDRLERNDFSRSAFVRVMADFRLKKKVEISFNMIYSFRHLPTEKQAVAHLQCMADATNNGGLYILGLHLIPTVLDERIEDEAWTAARGNLRVNTYMWSKGIDEKTRIEYLGLKIDVWTPTKHLEIEDEMLYRTYSARQMASYLKKVPEFEIVATFDFAYELDEPIEVDSRTEDVVFILRKK